MTSRSRKHGKTKYRSGKVFRGFVDMLYIWFWKKFSSRPLHLFGLAGLLITFLGIITGIWTLYQWIGLGTDLSDNGWFILTFFLILIGMIFFMTGILFDLVIRTYYSSSDERRYIVESVERK